jgi:hypothetical protein
MRFVHPPPIKGFRLTRLLLRTATILLLVGGCRSARAAANVDPQTRSFFCERSHTNHAWSYQHRGIYVDGAGSVFRFEHTDADQHLLRVPADSMTEQALLARYAPGRRQVGTVTAAEMERRHAQAVEARDGTFSERMNRGADMGDAVWRCWLPDTTGIYREVVLRQDGDWEFENRSPAASELSRWLDSLALRLRE